MKEEKVYWIVMKITMWEGLKIEPNLYPFQDTPKFNEWFGMGFCRVFESYDEAEKHADGGWINCVRACKEEG